MQRQIYVWRERGRTKGWQFGVPAEPGSGEGMGGESAALGQVIWGLTIPLSSPNHQNQNQFTWPQPLKERCTVSARYSVGLAEVVEAVTIPRWGIDSTDNLGKQRSPLLPAGPSLLSQTPRSSHLLRALTAVSVLGACAFEPKICASPKSKGQTCVDPDPPFPSPGAEKMQNNRTLSKWQDHYFSQFEII